MKGGGRVQEKREDLVKEGMRNDTHWGRCALGSSQYLGDATSLVVPSFTAAQLNCWLNWLRYCGRRLPSLDKAVKWLGGQLRVLSTFEVKRI